MFSQAIISRTVQAGKSADRTITSVICGQAYQMNTTNWSIGRHSSAKFVREAVVHQDSEGVL